MDKKYLVLISGKMRSGKNTFADLLMKECTLNNMSSRQDAYASVLKEMCSKEFHMLSDYLNNFTNELKALYPLFGDIRFDGLKQKIADVVNKLYIKPENWTEDKTDITRLILQIVGTNIIRKHIDDDYWIKQLIKKVNDYTDDVIVVTDVRFPNEIDLPHKMVEDRIVRSVKIERNTGIKSIHSSETSLDNYNWFDYIVDNNGDLETLQQSAKTILNDIKTL